MAPRCTSFLRLSRSQHRSSPRIAAFTYMNDDLFQERYFFQADVGLMADLPAAIKMTPLIIVSNVQLPRMLAAISPASLDARFRLFSEEFT